MQSLLFPEFSPDSLDQQALNEWIQAWLDRLPLLSLDVDDVGDGALALRPLATPLGPMVAAASAAGLALLEFVDKARIESQLRRVQKAQGGPLLSCPARDIALNARASSSETLSGLRLALILDRVQDQIDAYFAGELTSFDLELAPSGTDFQHLVWDELIKIPFGGQTTYGHIAEAIDNPTASRAVGAANGSNPIAIIQPCHRVVGASGTLTGYAGGLWRKRRLLEMEADMLDRQAVPSSESSQVSQEDR